MEGYKHKTPIQIRFKDVDAFKHVNNANHFTYLELARVKYFDDVAGQDMNWSKQGIILANAKVDYTLPILFKDTIFIYTKCSRIGNKSFDLAYKIIKEENGKEILMAEASTVLVCYDYEKGKSIPMPDPWVQKLRSYDNL